MSIFNKLFGKSKSSDKPKVAEPSSASKQRSEEATPYKFDGVKALRIGNFPLAIGFFEKALAISPEFETRYYYAQALARSGRNSDAIVQYNLLIEEVPDHFLVLVERASLLLQQDDKELAFVDGSKALSLAQDNEEKLLVNRLLASIELARDNYQPALDLATSALAIDEHDTVSALLKARSLLKLERLDEAASYINQARERFPEEERFLLHQATLYRSLNQPDDALTTYNQTLELDPFNEEAVLGIAEIFEQSERANEALSLLREFSSEARVSSIFLRRYASLLRQAGQSQEAEAIEKSLSEDSEGQVVNFTNLYEGGIY